MNKISELKNQAKNLRKALAAQGLETSHSQSLEMVAKTHGARDWNTLVAQAKQVELHVGETVKGEYFGKAFTGKLVSVERMGAMKRVAVAFDEPVVIAQLGDQAHTRQRIRVTLGANLQTVEKRSDGRPHMVLFV